MDKQGVLLIPEVISYNVSDHTTKKGDHEYFTELEMKYTWMDVDSNETIVCTWYGQGLDNGEKGVGKSLTYSEKYFLLKFFNIATDKDDPDSFQKKHADNDNPNPQQQQTQPQNQPQQPPEPAESIYRTDKQKGMMFAIFANNNIKDGGKMKGILSLMIGREIVSSSDILKTEARKILDIMTDETKLSEYLTIVPGGKEAIEGPKGPSAKEKMCDEVTALRTKMAIDGARFITVTAEVTGKTKTNISQYTMTELQAIIDTLNDQNALNTILAKLDGKVAPGGDELHF